MKIKSLLGFFKLCVLILVVFHQQSFGVDNISPIAKEVKEVINGISDCHVHLLYDELDLDGPILNPSVTIWKTNASHDARLRKHAKCLFRKLDITRVKRIHCVYAIIFLASQKNIYSYKRKPLGGSGPPVHVYFNRVISYAFYTLQNCFWEDRSLSARFIGSTRTLSSYSYVLFFTRLREYKWLHILEGDPKLLSFSPRTGVRHFSVQNAKSKAYFQCSFCSYDIPLLIPMKKSEQQRIYLINDFAGKYQHKVLRVMERLYRINYDWFTKELNVNLLSRGRAFDSPRLFQGPLNGVFPTKRAHELFILNLLVKNNNATLILCPTDTKLNPMICDERKFNNIIRQSVILLPNNEKLMNPDEFEFQDFLDTLGSTFIVIGVEGQTFLTCYHEQTVSFRFYMNPFQRDLWITLAFTAFGMAVLLHIYIMRVHKSKLLKFSPYMFILSTITDDNCAMPGSLAREPVIRIALGPWFLMTVVLVNAYVGLVITGLTSPLPKESVDSFSKLTQMHFSPDQIVRGLLWSQNVHIYVPKFSMMNKVDEDNLFASSGTRKFNPGIDFKIYSSLNRGEAETALSDVMSNPQIIVDPLEVRYQLYRGRQAFSRFLMRMYKYFFFSNYAVIDQVMDRNLSIDLRRELLKNATIPRIEDAILINLIVPEHMSVPTSYLNGKWNYSFASAVEEEIIKCGRSAYADIRSDVDLEHRYLTKHYPWIKFFQSKEEVSKQMDSWMFPSMHDKVPIFEDMKALLFTGIYRKLEEYFMQETYLDRKLYTTSSKYYNIKSTQEKSPLSLADSIQTSFFLLGSAFLVCLLTLVCESFWHNKMTLGSKVAMMMGKFVLLIKKMYVILYRVVGIYVRDLAIF
jgi:hypothetical protein